MSGAERIDTVCATNICKIFGTMRAVDDVSFSLNPGETVALVGHNGAGKTTLVKLMLGLSRPDSGSIRLMGANPCEASAAIRTQIGFLPEIVSFNMALTGRETLSFYARLKGIDPRRCAALLDKVGLAREAADRKVRTYSKGMRQRLGLAQALLGEPRLLLFDEPTSGLDPLSRQHFYEILAELRATGATVLLSSHALKELEGRVDRVIVLNAGKKIAEGSLDTLRDMAQLASRITIRSRTALTGDEAWPQTAKGWHKVAPDLVECWADTGEAVRLLPALAACHDRIADIAIVPPTLDDLYAHFVSHKAATA